MKRILLAIAASMFLASGLRAIELRSMNEFWDKDDPLPALVICADFAMISFAERHGYASKLEHGIIVGEWSQGERAKPIVNAIVNGIIAGRWTEAEAEDKHTQTMERVFAVGEATGYPEAYHDYMTFIDTICAKLVATSIVEPTPTIGGDASWKDAVCEVVLRKSWSYNPAVDHALDVFAEAYLSRFRRSDIEPSKKLEMMESSAQALKNDLIDKQAELRRCISEAQP